ncbi:MAG: signal peptidase I [Planctomycetota bacterium]
MAKQKKPIHAGASGKGGKKKPPFAKRLVGNAESIIIAVIFVLVVRQFTAETFNIPTISMEPTLLGRPGIRGDRLIADKFYYRWHPVNRWDVTVFKSPIAEPGGYKGRYIRHMTYIKRMVGLPGEIIEIKHGDIYITNDELKNEIPKKPPGVRDALWFDAVRTEPNRKDFLNQWKFVGEGAAPVREADGAVLIDAGGKTAQFLCRAKILEDTTVAEHKGIYKYIANPSGDVLLEIKCRPEKSGGLLSLELVEEGNVYILEVPVGEGRTVMKANITQPVRDGLEAGAWDGSPREKDVSMRPERETTIRFSNADDRIVAEIDGETIFEEYVPVQPAYENDDEYEKMEAAGKNSLSFTVKDASISFRDLRIYRDIYYLDVLIHPVALRPDMKYEDKDWLLVLVDRQSGEKALVSQVGGWMVKKRDGTEKKVDPARHLLAGIDPEIRYATKEPYRIGSDEYFALGDNSPNSKDSRAWQCLKHKHLIGRAVIRFWPLPPFGPFRPGLVR